ncbi:hypothetical protein KAFR_0H00520 [Kazachstania africana CBS 2517]|uniref:CUE domain-containing protein n=1 Tax=Kazachstania africana (strain ATCC 22294 / BCRC 22015 / CBS 2517 / CECT 1963 / NBRC 1671 / NRRL Y-8276) TaxID=1071382 RepID=H2AYQ5_KAZAF|nr:hypothetical protein KAFR_0H00520 [Kazachstania africana CBS 2517]CCF59461.1 hypothetical protein KAFR_0H00520 [Kazachstania africana CBS 2517]
MSSNHTTVIEKLKRSKWEEINTKFNENESLINELAQAFPEVKEDTIKAIMVASKFDISETMNALLYLESKENFIRSIIPDLDNKVLLSPEFSATDGANSFFKIGKIFVSQLFSGASNSGDVPATSATTAVVIEEPLAATGLPFSESPVTCGEKLTTLPEEPLAEEEALELKKKKKT